MVKCEDCVNLRLVIEVMQCPPFNIRVGYEEPNLKDIDKGEICGYHYECGIGHPIIEHSEGCDKEIECLDFESIEQN